MTTSLRPIDAPDLQPLRNSFEYDQLEADLKDAFMAVFNAYIRPAERQVNLHGMPHLGDTELIERTLKDYGLAIVRRDATRTAFLLKAARARNPRRGMIFLRQYLQSVWPGMWKVEQLWHPVATADAYPAHVTPLIRLDLGNDVTAVYDTDNGDELPTLYRTTWHGQQLLTTDPRSNSLRQSRNLSIAPWAQNIGGFWTSGTTTNVSPPDASEGRIDGVTRFVATDKPHYVFSRQDGISAPAGKRTASLWVYVPSGQDVWKYGFAAAWGNVEAGNGLLYSTLDQWTRVSSTATLAADRDSVELRIYPNGQTPRKQFVFYACIAQEEPGPLATYEIETLDTPESALADYTVDANGLATFSGGAPAPTPLTYFRTGRVRVTLPASIDNGLGLVEIAKAFRPTLAARLMLELQLSTVFENTGNDGGLALANAATGIMPFMAIGTLTK